jgi:pre-mRNA 3'-end-processing factor FIP1
LQTFGIGKPVRPAPSEKKGKFSVEEFDQIGLINGQLAVDLDLESLEDKPWRQPGLFIFVNYGF